MPQVPINLLLNRVIYATGPVDILDASLNVVERRKAGDVVGEVDSWVQRGGALYLTLKPYTRPRLVRVPNTALTLSKTDAEAVRLKQRAEERRELGPLRAAEEAAIWEEKGTVAYYFERYGKVVLLVIAGAYLAGQYIKKRA